MKCWMRENIKEDWQVPYDNVEPLPPSYFDTEHFQYYVGEESEPPYKDWSQSNKSKTDYNP